MSLNVWEEAQLSVVYVEPEDENSLRQEFIKQMLNGINST